jgi:hypothetical protein
MSSSPRNAVILRRSKHVSLNANNAVILRRTQHVILNTNTLVILSANTLVILRRSRRIWPRMSGFSRSQPRSFTPRCSVQDDKAERCFVASLP